MDEDELALLAEAGWFEGRQVDITTDVSALEGAGYTVTDAAVEILREFSGLEVRVWGNPNPLWIDGYEAARQSDPNWCRAYAEAEGLTMTPIGEYSHLTILIDQRGIIWGGFDDLYGEIGDTMPDLVREQFLVHPPRMLDRELPR